MTFWKTTLKLIILLFVFFFCYLNNKNYLLFDTIVRKSINYIIQNVFFFKLNNLYLNDNYNRYDPVYILIKSCRFAILFNG